MSLDAATLREAMEPTEFYDDSPRLAEMFPHFVEAMRAAQINTVRRAAAWCSQLGHESAGLKYMAEIQTSSPNWSWDRTRYRGRGPIQLTWQGNYRKFGQWCHTQGYVNDPELFVNQPELVEQPRWGFLAASWYWLNAGPRPGRINEFADAGDILAVSRCVNGWIEGRMPNGWADRQGRWDRCLELGDRLLISGAAPVPQEVKPVGDPIWLPDVLRAAGLRCDIYPGAFQRGHGDFGAIWGVVAHHTGSFGETPRGIAEHPSLGLASQLYLSPQGVYTLCGVGVAWHAGSGGYPGIAANNANQVTIGIEAANDGGGRPGLPHRASWSNEQYDAYVRGVAAILKKLGQPASHVIGHKEWAGAAQGKWDPGAIDMNVFRADVAAAMGQVGGVVEDMANVPQDQWDRVYRELTQLHASRSPYAGEDDKPFETWAGFQLNVDAMQHLQQTDRLAVEYGDDEAIGLVVRCAAGRGRYGDDPHWVQHAEAVLRKIPTDKLEAWKNAHD